jgi:uncharacterized membrane protein YfcA
MSDSRAAARGAIALGVLAVAAIPAGVLVAKYAEEVELLQAQLVAVPVAFVLGLAALSLARRARYRLDRSVRRRGRRTVAVARWVAWAGLYAGITGALALGVYGALRLMGD